MSSGGKEGLKRGTGHVCLTFDPSRNVRLDQPALFVMTGASFSQLGETIGGCRQSDSGMLQR